jgi:DNA-binding transcriptional regulator YiaG
VAVGAPEITGGLIANPDESDALRIWLESRSTGEEYGRALMVHRQSLASLWGVMTKLPPAPPLTEQPVDELQARALSMAAAHPFVARQRLDPIELTDELIEDVQKTTGLTYGQIAQMFGISERAVAGWKQSGVPRHREPLMRALRSIGLILVGSLGPDGVSLWLRSGRPSRIERLAAGELTSVVEEARDYEFSPAT